MINILNKDIITLIDLELVSDDFSLKNRWHQPSDFPEIIQIGALRAIYENGKFSEQDGFLEVIKPQLHSNIPNYTLNLLKKKKTYFEKGVNLKKALQALNIFCSKSLFNFANGVDGEIISLNKIKLNYNFTTPKIYNIVDYLKIGVNDALTNNHDALEDCKVVLKKLNNVIGQTTNKNNKISINETTRSPLIHELVLKYDKNN